MLYSKISTACVVLLLAGCSLVTPAAPAPTSSPTALPPVTSTVEPTKISVPAALPSPVPRFTSTPAATRTATASPSPTEPLNKRYKSAFGIDYTRPEKYLTPGEQTRFSDPKVMGVLLTRPRGMPLLGEIIGWMRIEFKSTAAGGRYIGISTTEQLLRDRLLTGCHDWALVYAAFARALGYPTVIVDAAGIPFMAQVQSGQKASLSGHVFVEVFTSNKWVLIDSTNGWYVENDYDPANPVIPLQGNFPGESAEWYGFYVMKKGLDTWDYDIHSNEELVRLMHDTARKVPVESLVKPRYTFDRFK